LDPAMVVLVQPKVNTKSKLKDKDGNKWTQKVIFPDDGHILRTASTAVLVAIDPDDNNGKKASKPLCDRSAGQRGRGQ
jgi:hypothetical protein